MARIRTIKPEFFTSLTIADLTPEQRLTFIGLWTHVDDEGRCVDDPRLIKAAVWPLDDRTAADIEIDLKALSESSLITRYVLNRKRYLAVTGWSEHQRINRPTPSKLPAPEQGEPPTPTPPTRENGDSLNTHAQLTEDSPQERNREGNREQGTGRGEHAWASVPGQRTEQPPPVQRSDDRPSPIDTDGFALTDSMRRWALDTFGPGLDLDYETAQFVDHFRAQAVRRPNWPAEWQKWIRRSAKFASERANRPPLRAVGGKSHTPYQQTTTPSAYANGF